MVWLDGGGGDVAGMAAAMVAAQMAAAKAEEAMEAGSKVVGSVVDARAPIVPRSSSPRALRAASRQSLLVLCIG